MKRAFIVLALAALVAVPSFSQLRLDIGVDVPKGVGAAFEGSADISQETVDFFNNYFIPFPEAALHYQFDLGMVKLGLGARGFTLILETILWPNAFAEVHLGPLAIEAQIGGGLFGMVGLYSSMKTGKVFFPDISAWYELGKKKNFRLGGGAMGFYIPDMTANGLAFAFYLGAKATIEFSE